MAVDSAWKVNAWRMPFAPEQIDTEIDPEYVFEGLQGNYTSLREGAWCWLELHRMSISHFRRSIARFPREAAAKLAHADALDAELWRRVELQQAAKTQAAQ
jgi:hypothetical protein